MSSTPVSRPGSTAPAPHAADSQVARSRSGESPEAEAVIGPIGSLDVADNLFSRELRLPGLTDLVFHELAPRDLLAPVSRSWRDVGLRSVFWQGQIRKAGWLSPPPSLPSDSID